MISIHALVKRATSFHCLYNTPFLYFNPRPREEGDYMPNIPFSPATHFNPRPREEGDTKSLGVLPQKWISIHALVKRATAVVDCSNQSSSISIHALVKRATMGELEIEVLHRISIHALVKRATKHYNICS